MLSSHVKIEERDPSTVALDVFQSPLVKLKIGTREDIPSFGVHLPLLLKSPYFKRHLDSNLLGVSSGLTTIQVEENFPEAAIGKFLQWLYNGRFECIDLTELSDIDYVAEVFEVPEMKALVNTKVEDLRKRVEGSTATDNFTDRVKFAEYIYKSSVNVYGGTLDLQRSDMRKKISQGLARDSLYLHRNLRTRGQLEELLKSQPELLYDVLMHLFDEQEEYKKVLKETSHPQTCTSQSQSPSPQTPLPSYDSSIDTTNTPKPNQSDEKRVPEFVDLCAIKESPGPMVQEIETIETVIRRGKGRPRRNTTSPSTLKNTRNTSSVVKREPLPKKVRFARKEVHALLPEMEHNL